VREDAQIVEELDIRKEGKSRGPFMRRAVSCGTVGCMYRGTNPNKNWTWRRMVFVLNPNG